MNLGLKDKNILVTGGAKGIGLSVVNLLIESKANIIVIDNDSENLNNIKNNNIQKHLLDLTDTIKLANLLENLEIDVHGIVNNAGTNDGISLRSNVDEFRSSLERNLIHYFVTVKHLHNKFPKEGGSVVNISSKVAYTGQAATSGYIASKGAINALTRGWALELAEKNIRVNSIVPAEVDTPQYTKWLLKQKDYKEILNSIEKKIPLQKRLTKCKEIANGVVFLLSDLSTHITGQHIFIDGGYTHLDN